MTRARVTPPEVFFGRRRFLETLGLGTIASFASRCGYGSRAEAMLAPPFARPDVFPARANGRVRLPDALERHSVTPRHEAAAHPLTFVATGVYGAPLLRQHGAPVRIGVPWKYGYKSPKSVVRIELVKEQPDTFWQLQAHEYGYLSNVNPNIPHPRWSQKTSYWLDTGESFETPLFNGYEAQVAALYPDEPRTPQTPPVTGQRAR